MLLKILFGILIFILSCSIWFLRKQKKLTKESNDRFFKLLKQQEELNKQFTQQINDTLSSKEKLDEEYTTMLRVHNTERDALKQQYEVTIAKLQATYDRELSARKSSEVRVGQISEQLLPFLESWPYDPKDFRFIGSPFDAFQLTNDKLLLVEIKTGKSRLSKKQEHVKKLVKEGKVEFVTVRINEEGVQLL